MAALNKCNPAQLLILHIIKFLIYTLCFHGPTHNSLVLNSWVVKTNTLDKCWFLYPLFFGWQFSFNLPQSQTSNSTLRKLSDLVRFVHSLPWRKTSLITALYPQILLTEGGVRNGEYQGFSPCSRYWSSLEDISFCGRISNRPWSQKQNRLQKA